MGHKNACLTHLVLKADRPHLHYYPYTSPDYRHADKQLRLVMTPNALCCTKKSTNMHKKGEKRNLMVYNIYKVKIGYIAVHVQIEPLY